MGQWRPGFGSVFLLNSTAYLCANYLRQDLRPTPRFSTSSRARYRTPSALAYFRTAKAGYFEANLSPSYSLMLAEDKEKSGGAAKKKFTRFFDFLEEIRESHQLERRAGGRRGAAHDVGG